MTIGIYKITNKKTGQIYIGQSINIEKRFKEHVYGKDCSNSYIDNAIQKYGKDCFNFEIIEEFDKNTPFLDDVLNDSEQYYIAAYNTFEDDFHYNLTIGGDGTGFGENHPMYGRKHSKKTKRKMSKNHADVSGKNNPFYGKKHTKKTKKKMSEVNSGKNNPNYGNPNNYHPSEETKKKMSESKKGKYIRENNPFYGKHHTEESKKKIRKSLTKKYARIIKVGRNKQNKQQYAIKYKGKTIKTSISIDKLFKWFLQNYPLEIIKTYKENS